jgi:hypothetical protein
MGSRFATWAQAVRLRDRDRHRGQEVRADVRPHGETTIQARGRPAPQQTVGRDARSIRSGRGGDAPPIRTEGGISRRRAAALEAAHDACSQFAARRPFAVRRLPDARAPGRQFTNIDNRGSDAAEREVVAEVLKVAPPPAGRRRNGMTPGRHALSMSPCRHRDRAGAGCGQRLPGDRRSWARQWPVVPCLSGARAGQVTLETRKAAEKARGISARELRARANVPQASGAPARARILACRERARGCRRRASAP